MSIADEGFIKAQLEKLGLPTNITLQLTGVCDESTDGTLAVLKDGRPTVYSVQCGEGYIGLNETGYKIPGDQWSFYFTDWGLWGVQPDDFQALYTTLLTKLAE